jgi:NAD(P)-dependent dehydrogenase (short-subunit alcohol dehydrogenase family)
VCISSIAGVESTGAPVTYSVAKSAINSYVKNISKHLTKSGIRINAVAPGNIMSESSVWKEKFSENPKDVKTMLKKEVAMGRFGTPEEISNLVVFLCSEKSSFITGSTFIVDGGQTKRV